MSAARENANIWYYLSGYWLNGKWRGWYLLTKNVWRNEYIWHDSFGQYWNRWLICSCFGHREVKDISDPEEPKRMHCFRCERNIP